MQYAIRDETLVGEGRVYGGGLQKLEPKELANVTAGFILNALPRARDIKLAARPDRRTPRMMKHSENRDWSGLHNIEDEVGKTAIRLRASRRDK